MGGGAKKIWADPKKTRGTPPPPPPPPPGAARVDELQHQQAEAQAARLEQPEAAGAKFPPQRGTGGVAG
ncbi:hypothetical protein, partial [Nocardia abscessus]|uniref:hypothetical protein n=1 Tax=Nocardia abscessus TaxID=120957 RepID=UPI002457387A